MSHYGSKILLNRFSKSTLFHPELQVLRLADGVLYEGQLRLARRHRQISAALLEVRLLTLPVHKLVTQVE